MKGLMINMSLKFLKHIVINISFNAPSILSMFPISSHKDAANSKVFTETFFRLNVLLGANILYVFLERAAVDQGKEK